MTASTVHSRRDLVERLEGRRDRLSPSLRHVAAYVDDLTVAPAETLVVLIAFPRDSRELVDVAAARGYLFPAATRRPGA